VASQGWNGPVCKASKRSRPFLPHTGFVWVPAARLAHPIATPLPTPRVDFRNMNTPVCGRTRSKLLKRVEPGGDKRRLSSLVFDRGGKTRVGFSVRRSHLVVDVDGRGHKLPTTSKTGHHQLSYSLAHSLSRTRTELLHIMLAMSSHA